MSSISSGLHHFMSHVSLVQNLDSLRHKEHRESLVRSLISLHVSSSPAHSGTNLNPNPSEVNQPSLGNLHQVAVQGPSRQLYKQHRLLQHVDTCGQYTLNTLIPRIHLSL